MYVYTDASDTGWSYVVTQYGSDNLERLCYVKSHHFNRSEAYLKVSGREGDAVVMMIRDMGRKLLQYDWTLRTDHRNLQYMSTSNDPIIRRWFLELRFVCRKIQLIPGDLNVFADFLSRQPVSVKHGLTLLFNGEG